MFPLAGFPKQTKEACCCIIIATTPQTLGRHMFFFQFFSDLGTLDFFTKKMLQNWQFCLHFTSSQPCISCISRCWFYGWGCPKKQIFLKRECLFWRKKLCNELFLYFFFTNWCTSPDKSFLTSLSIIFWGIISNEWHSKTFVSRFKAG